MRKTIAKRLKAAYSDAPVFFPTRQFDRDATVEFVPAQGKRRDLLQRHRHRRVWPALCDVPDVNAVRADDSIIKRAAVDISGGPRGLITLVIRRHKKDLAAVAADTRASHKGKDGKFALDEYTNSTFTISNLGMKGIEQFTAILNPPEACILAVGGMAQVPVVVDGSLAVGWRMSVTLTCDHRVVDGALGADFLTALAKYIEDPSLLGG